MEAWMIDFPLFVILVISTYTDIRWMLVFNWLSLPGMLYFLVMNTLLDPQHFLSYLFGLIILGGISVVLAVLSKGQLGGGDIKLFALVGVAVGWKVGVSILSMTFIIAVGCALVLLVYHKWMKRQSPPKELPLAPFLLIATAIFILF